MGGWLKIALALFLLSVAFAADEHAVAKLFLDKNVLPNGDTVLSGYVSVSGRDNNGDLTMYSANDAKILFYSGSDIISGCETPPAIQDSAASGTGSGATRAIYHYECTVPKAQFEGKCITITAKLIGPVKYGGASAYTTLCGANSQLIGQIETTLDEKLNAAASKNYSACVLGFILLGLLLATMFYSGRSPLSLLDITTPNLPSPKTVAASGQVLGHMVYGRMMRISNEMMDNMDKNARKPKDRGMFLRHEDDVLKKMSGNQKGDFEKRKRMISDSDADARTKSLLRMLALKMIERGKNLADIDRLIGNKKSLLRYIEEEHRTLAKMINELRNDAKQRGVAGDAGIADAMDSYFQRYIHANRMNILTGLSGENRKGSISDFFYRTARVLTNGPQVFAPYYGGNRGVKKVVESVQKVFPGIGRLPIIGGFIGTSIDAAFRSARITNRYGEVLAGSLIRGGMRVAKGKKGKEYVSQKMRQIGAELEQEAHGQKQMGYFERMGKRMMSAGSAETTKVGGFSPIHLKMEELYKTLYKEAHYDVMSFLLRKIYAELGVDFNLSEMDFAGLYKKPENILQKCNVDPESLRAIEHEIRSVLTGRRGEHESEYEHLDAKVRGLERIANSVGARLGGEWSNAYESIHGLGVADSAMENTLRLMELQGMLRGFHNTDRDGFCLHVGMESMPEGSVWAHFNLRKLIHSAEEIGDTYSGGLADVMLESWLWSVNRTVGLGLGTDYAKHLVNGAETAGAIKSLGNDLRRRYGFSEPEVQHGIDLGRMIHQSMLALLTDEGRQAMNLLGGWSSMLTGGALMKKLLGGEGWRKDIAVEFGDSGRSGFIKDQIRGTRADELLEKGIDLVKIRKLFPQFMKGGAKIGYYDEKGVPVYWGDDSEIGPLKGWWKTDMKRSWTTGNYAGEGTIGYYVNGIFSKGYKMPYNAALERELAADPTLRRGAHGEILDANGVVIDFGRGKYSKKFAEDEVKPRYMRDTFKGEVTEFLNGVIAMNAYKHTNETMRFYMKTMQAMYSAFIDDENARNGMNIKDRKRELEMFEKELDTSTPEGMEQLRRRLNADHERFTEFMRKPVTYDMIANAPHAWVMFHEGGYAPFVKGMPLSDFDRVIGGYVAIKDDSKWRRFDPQSMDLKFEQFGAEGMDYKAQFAALQNVKDPKGSTQYQDKSGRVSIASWTELLENMGEWAKGSHERQKIFNTVLWRYASSTEDWHTFWNQSEITIKPKNEVLGIRIGIMPFGSHSEMPEEIMGPAQWAREKLRGVGQWIERSSMYTSGAVYRASYDINPVSGYFLQKYYDFARDVFMREPGTSVAQHLWGAEAADYQGTTEAMVKDAKKFWQYQILWDFGIDRNPWKHSTSYGLQSALASSFHWGPAAAWDPTFYKTYFQKSDYYAYEASTWPVRIARYMALPAITAFRGFQMALFGYPNKWNYNEASAMQPWQYRNPDAIGALRSMVNPFNTSLNWGSGIKAAVGKMLHDDPDYYQGDMIRRDLGGPQYRRGLKTNTTAETSWIAKGMEAYARDGGRANPGMHFATQDGGIRLTSTMAEFLAHRMGGVSGYYSEQEHVGKQAHTTYIKREIAAPALLLKREEELKGYSPLANPIHAWWNPLLFIWHMPISPIGGPRDWYMHYKEGTRRMEWEGMSTGQKISQVISGGGGGMMGTAGTRVLHPFRDIVYCQNCGSPMPRWGTCSKCAKRQRGMGAP